MGIADKVVPAQHIASKRSFQVAEFDPPTGREEAWRFTPKTTFKPLLDDAAGTGQLRLATQIPAGASVRSLPSGDWAARAATAPMDRLAVLAAAHAPEVTLVEVPADVELAEPIVLRFAGESAAEVVWGGLQIEVGAHARATVVLEYTGSATFGGMVSVVVGDGASVDLVSVQNWADDAVHGGQLSAKVGRDAKFRSIVATLGGKAVRLVHSVDYNGPGGDAELLGAFYVSAGQHAEHRILADHTQPHCRSNVVYKGALAGEKAHSVWIGDVIIRAEAVGTDTYEVNRNLLLTDGARADSVPNLEIETGDVVGAGHASATGRFDDDQLFYLQSRGIPAAVARRLVVRGFFIDVIRKIGAPAVEAELLAAIDRKLATLDSDSESDVLQQYAGLFEATEVE